MHWIVGDVHGCALELDEFCKRARFDPAHDELWSAGDLINRGPDSAAALRLWSDLDGLGVLGNHDLYGIGAWLGMPRNARGDDLDPLLEDADVDLLMGRLSALPLLARVGRQPNGRDVWLIHAGLHPAWCDPEVDETTVKLLAGDPRSRSWRERPETRFATRVRYCTPHGRIGSVDRDGASLDAAARPWDAFYSGEALIVHGHWAQRGHYRGERTMGLDSGCTYGGGLTAWCLEEDRVLHVPSR